jgi:pyruvate dehydrogenase E1 component alpha subunit
MPGVRVDGMDVLAVYHATMEAAARAREGEGPSLIEAVTYRYRGHSMSDPAEYRSKREERIWQERDPIKALKRRLLGERRVPESRLEAIDRDVNAIIDDAIRFADESPEPPVSELTRDVYVEDGRQG